MTLQHVGLVLYHSIRAYLESPAFGGYGPMIAVAAYLLIVVLISERYRLSLNSKMSQEAAIDRSGWLIGFLLTVGFAAVWFWIAHP